MYGWRAKIGRISPSPETVGAEEWRRSMPDGVCVVETRTLLHDVTVDNLSETAKHVERAALELASAEVDVILQAGTAIAFFRGFGHDQELSRRIHAVTGIQATTSLTAVVEALRALGIQRPAIATPYLADIDARLVEVLEKSGFEVAAIRGMGLKKSIDMGKVTPEETYRLAREVVRSAPKPDGILISCGNLRSFEAIEPLELDTGLPLVTSNQAGLWQAMRMAGIKDRLTSLGRLLNEH
jgi:maleate isomerase